MQECWLQMCLYDEIITLAYPVTLYLKRVTFGTGLRIEACFIVAVVG
jgi:hypothetical protein